ncbi:hypothetical protein VNO78_24731 [Psophocarpus tetragonolobus]|uniref:Uncharacterized protein n=1 Tax=Psophocarpus tetragonolobus TaxID=3891 RepID=A0AAN9XET6_PSOTE
MAPHGECFPRKSHNLERTVSDISFENAKCECCGMCEECTPEYIERVRDKFSGKWVCGLCAEAVKDELEKNGGKKEEAVSAHMSACVRFNKYGRAFPVLFQAQAMKEMLKKNTTTPPPDATSTTRPNRARAPNIPRTSSCIPAITREINDIKIAN